MDTIEALVRGALAIASDSAGVLGIAMSAMLGLFGVLKCIHFFVIDPKHRFTYAVGAVVMAALAWACYSAGVALATHDRTIIPSGVVLGVIGTVVTFYTSRNTVPPSLED